MNTYTYGIIAAVVASFVAGSVTTASAQTAFTGTGTGFGESAVENRNEELADDIEDDFERNIERFGNEGRALGFEGSISARAAASSGNNESATVGLGANFGYFDGVNGYELSLSYRFVETENQFGNVVTDEDNLLYDLQYTRDFTPELYGFVKLQGSYTGDDDDGITYFDEVGNVVIGDSDVVRENDVFLGFGAGYRVINDPIQQWSLQAGPGYRFASFSNIDDAILAGELAEGDGDDIEEAALALTSNYYRRLSDTVFLNNDTNVIYSDSDTVLYNDFGVSVSMNESLALRTSILTEYHTDRLPGEEATDNTVGVSLVYNFN